VGSADANALALVSVQRSRAGAVHRFATGPNHWRGRCCRFSQS